MNQRKKGQNAESGTKNLKGRITITGKGTGYIPHPDFKDDIEISERARKGALHGDTVEFSIEKGKRTRRTQGVVIRVIERRKTEFVGTWDGKNVIPDDKKVDAIFSLPPNEAKKLAPKTKVLVAVTDWKKWYAKVVKSLGRKGIHETEMQAIALDKGFSQTYPKAVMAEADKIAHGQKPIPEDEIKKRRDFRKVPTCTIDPVTAQDFDDALSLQKLPNGDFEIGIHIADVSHYVRPHAALDGEARERGFSVYLVDRTIPMLPEILSNDLCSLNPNEDRLAFSAVFEMNARGEIKKRWFGKTVICSQKRFTYEEAQDVLNSGSGPMNTELITLRDIARNIRKKKFAEGAIDFETDEVVFELDKNGVPISIKKKERLETHKLVEEYMLLANREVAEFMWKAQNKKGMDGAFIYRIHADPNTEKIADLAIFVRALGYEFKTPNGTATSKEINALLRLIEGAPEAGLIKTAAIRSMAKAEYSPSNIGHFGLAFQYYTHFTSPIRRYPDLIVHRLLAKHLHGEKIGKDEFAEVRAISEEASEKEISAAEAERDSKKYKQVEYMMSHVGEEFSGIISGVTDWGIYVEENETKSDGLIHVSSLSDNSPERGENFDFNQKTYSLIGAKSKTKYRLGDSIRFRIVSADLERKQLNLELVK